MPSQPSETAREDVANALQLLETSSNLHMHRVVQFAGDDLAAIRARLRRALAKLDREGPPVGWVATKPEDRSLAGEDIEP